MIDAPVLTSVKARFDGLEVYDLEPASLTALPDVLGGRPVHVIPNAFPVDRLKMVAPSF